MISRTLLSLLVLSSLSSLVAQGYYDDAINLLEFCKMAPEYEDMSGDTVGIDTRVKELARALVDIDIFGDSSGSGGPWPHSNSGAVDPGEFNINDVSTATTLQNNNLKQYRVNRIEQEILSYSQYRPCDFQLFDSTGNFKTQYNTFPDQFPYLQKAVNALKGESTYAYFTSTTLNSLIGVSQAEIIQGITNWALTRAQTELMQAFLREWFDYITADSLMQVMFPNTLNMLRSSDISTIITDGATWRETFQQDLDNVPLIADQIADISFNKMDFQIRPAVRSEVISALSATSAIYREIGNGKKLDDLLLAISDDAYNDTTRTAIIDRSLVGLGVFMTATRIISSGQQKILSPKAVLSMSEGQLQSFWCITYIRQRHQIIKAFNLTKENEARFYNDVLKNILRFKHHIVTMCSNFDAISGIISNISSSKELTSEQFSRYISISFDIVESSVKIIDELSPQHSPLDQAEDFKLKYYEGIAYLPLIYEGIKSKRYGMVILNTVNLLTWFRELVIEEGLGTRINTLALFTSRSMGPYSGQEVVDTFKLKQSRLNEEYSATYKYFKRNIQEIKEKLNPQERYDIDSILTVIARVFELERPEKQQIVEELSRALDTSIEAVNRYGKLMTNIILAEDSEDISNVLEGTAMKTGGYLIRHQSAWSASVTFYPGFEGGREHVRENSKTIAKDGYVGVALPIGVEIAKGTNMRGLGAVGMFIQVFDLGAVLNYSFNNPDSVSSLPDIKFENVLSPGAYVTLHIDHTPITVGVGGSLSPGLRKVTSESAEFSASAFQFGCLIAVDLNVFPIWASKKKYKLKTKSFKNAYQ